MPIELGGKRGARIRAASADVLTATSDYNDAVRQLRATAANAFIDAPAWWRDAVGVIDAQRKSAEVYLGYTQALVDHAHALVAVEQATGIWDVTF